MTKKSDEFYIVGIGASAGGLQALEKFFENVPDNSDMAFVVVSHLDPSHKSLMPELLQKYSTKKVVLAEEGMEIQRGGIYIAPPRRNVAIRERTFHLFETSKTSMPIDYFFRSLATDQENKAICIILSGMGTDGTLGLREVKGRLGMAMVQLPESAQYASMARSAIETGQVDYILSPEKMPQQLLAYVEYTSGKVREKPISVKGEFAVSLEKIFALLRSHTGHDFSTYKQKTIRRRIERRMNVQQIDSISTYVRYLEGDPGELVNLFKDLLIGVTSFFRDKEAFAILKSKVLPQILEDKPQYYVLRVWVSGCSTGEEAYSIAILIREVTEKLSQHYGLQVFATDIDQSAIDIARAGIYPASIAADVEAHRLKRFFQKKDDTYQIKKDIRESLVFAQQNIIRDPPFTKLDLICCRNLLIYLNAEVQKKMLPRFHYSLKPGGVLFLGSSETIGSFTDLFVAVDKKWKIFKRLESVVSTKIEFPITLSIEKKYDAEMEKKQELSVAQLAEKTLLSRYAPPSVIVNDRCDILYIHGRTGKYLEPAPGEAHLNLYEMAREGLKAELPAAIHKALTQKMEVSHKGIKVLANGGYQMINLLVKPIGKLDFAPGTLLVAFEELPPEGEIEETKSLSEEKADAKIKALEKELQYNKESLQSMIEELETSNEELKSANEELQSTNEELQSTNEELETSKEEQQSLNEELATVNNELQEKVEELTVANNDMKNLLDSIEIPTIFLDNDLCIKRFTAHATKVIKVIMSDVGRPIGDIATNLKYENLIADAEAVLANLVFREREVETHEGNKYLMRILPYRTIDNVIDGVAITFLDITAWKLAEEASKDALVYAESITEIIRDPLIILDRNLKVQSANKSFYQTFQLTAEETKDKSIYDLGNSPWNLPKLRDLLENIIPQNAHSDHYEFECVFPINDEKMLLKARCVEQKGGRQSLILLAIEDMT